MNSDNKYIDLCKVGDTEAYRFLVEKYQQMIFGLAFRLLYNEADAKDLTQEVFIKAWQRIDGYKNQYKFSTWLYKIACNACYDILRQDRKMKTCDCTISEIKSEENPEEILNNKQLKELIEKITDQMTPKQKLVFILSELEELDTKEIIQITGMTASKIKSNLYLARKYVKSKINRDEYE